MFPTVRIARVTRPAGADPRSINLKRIWIFSRSGGISFAPTARVGLRDEVLFLINDDKLPVRVMLGRLDR